jgi:uncharacterized iron-regulated membrane protein
MKDCLTSLSTYSFGMSGPIIWSLHIIIGLILLVLGSMAINHFTKVKDEDVTQINNRKDHVFLTNYHVGFGIFFVVLALFAILYHLHLWYYN